MSYPMSLPSLNKVSHRLVADAVTAADGAEAFSVSVGLDNRIAVGVQSDDFLSPLTLSSGLPESHCATPPVLGQRHDFHVPKVLAQAVATQMVDSHAVRDWPVDQFPADTVCIQWWRAEVAAELSIAVTGASTFPGPAIIGSCHTHSRLIALCEWAWLRPSLAH